MTESVQSGCPQLPILRTPLNTVQWRKRLSVFTNSEKASKICSQKEEIILESPLKCPTRPLCVPYLSLQRIRKIKTDKTRILNIVHRSHWNITALLYKQEGQWYFYFNYYEDKNFTIITGCNCLHFTAQIQTTVKQLH